MKSKLLVTTAALALMISASANAQTRSDTKSDQPAATRSHSERGSTSKEMNRSDARDTDRSKAGTSTTTGQAPAAGSTSLDSKAASDTKSDTRKPASAQDSTSPSRSNAAQSMPNGKAGDKSDKSDSTASDKNSARSTQSNEPSGTKSNTAGQTDTKQPSAAQRDTTDRNQATTNSKSDDTNRAATTDTRSSTRVSASLQTEQKTRLHQAITKLDVKPVTSVNFSVSVGTAVPRTVSLHPVPTTIVEIVPQYRGYDYFVVRDQVVIVQPETHKIVDVIERSGPSHARAGTTATRERRVNLSEKQRSYIRQHATSRRTTTTTTTTGAAPRGDTTIVVGEEVPSSIEIESFPADVYREVPTVREYRYVRSGSNMYLVDPSTRHVIEEIQ